LRVQGSKPRLRQVDGTVAPAAFGRTTESALSASPCAHSTGPTLFRPWLASESRVSMSVSDWQSLDHTPAAREAGKRSYEGSASGARDKRCGTPLQYSCLENPMDGGAWWAAVHGVAKSRIRLSDFTFTFLHWRRKWQPTPVFLPGESQGRGSLVGCCLWGRTESDKTEAT